MSQRFSVVIDSYNYRAFVVEAIESVLAQRLPAAEIIVVDDGSTDDTAALLTERYGRDSRVRLIVKENGGQLSAFMAGVAAATGDIVCFLDADDLWEPDHLEQLANAYALPSAPDFVYTNLRLFGQREGLWHAERKDRDFGLTLVATYCLRHWFGSPSSALSMSLSLARQVLDLPAALIANWRSGGDNVLVLGASLFAAHKRYLAAATVRYRAHGNNIWLDRPMDRLDIMRRNFQVDRLFAHYEKVAGIGPQSLRLARREFETKNAPTREELRLYQRAAWRAPLSFGKRLELVFTITRHYLRTRRAASQ